MKRVCQEKEKLNGTSNLRRRLSNAFTLMCPFVTARRWKRGAGGSSSMASHLDDDDQARRESIDHTLPSLDSSRSIYGVCFGDLSPSNHSHGFVNEALQPSRTEPSSFYHQTEAGNYCPCRDCSMYNVLHDYQLHQSESSSHQVASDPQPISSHSSPLQSSPSQSNYDPALQGRIEAIRIQQQYLGDNHPDVIFALWSLAKVYQKRGNHVDAAAILKESQIRTALSHSMPTRQSFLGTFCAQNSQTEYTTMVPNEIFYTHQT